MDAVVLENKPKRIKRRKFSKPLIIITILLQLVVATAMAFVLVAYGPFETTRNYLIGSAMTSYTHQYLARLFFTSDQIAAVMNTDSSTAAKQVLSNVKPKNIGSSDVIRSTVNAEGGGLSGSAIEVKDPLRVHVAGTKYVNKRGELISEFAEEKDAIAAINAGGFSSGEDATGTGAVPSDFIFSNGSTWIDPSIDSDAVDDDRGTGQNVAAINADGQLIVGDYSFNQLKSMGVKEAVDIHGYKPLVVNGKGTYSTRDEAGFGIQPRTAIGQEQDGTIVLLVLDGRQAGASGARLTELQNVLINEYHCVTAVNLDGGSSTAMYYNGKIINHPSDPFGERSVASAFYVSR